MAMIPQGEYAPDFTLPDQFGRPFTLGRYRGSRLVLLNFFPAAFTPICSGEVPALNARQAAFATQANTVPVAISADTRFTQNAWCADLGGVCLPVLADAHPHGAVSRAYGAWIAGESLTDRASVLVGLDGRVRDVVYAGKDAPRDVDRLLLRARQLGQPGAAPGRPRGLPPQTALYVDDACPKCKAALRAARNAGGGVTVRYVNRDQVALLELRNLGIPQGLVVPALRLGLQGPVVVGADAIMATIANASCPVL